MEQTDQQAIDTLKEEINLLDDASIKALPFSLFEKKGNRTTRLQITSGEGKPIEGRNRWHDFVFRELTLVTAVRVNVSGYQGFHKFDFRWIDDLGKEHETSAKPEGDAIDFPVNSLCRSISFKPPSVFFLTTHVQSVEIEGIQRSDFRQMLDTLTYLQHYEEEAVDVIDKAVSRADARIAEAARLTAERSNVQKEITQAKAQLARNRKAVDEAALKRNELIAQNSADDAAIKEQQTRLSGLQAEYQGLTNKYTNLRKDVEQSGKELADLKSNINIFPSEIVGFANQARRTGWQYFALAAIPIIIMIIMFVLLIKGAADLTTVFERYPDAKIRDVMISRVPYVTIAVAIITACYKFARAFFLELIKINAQRLSLTKISIIARDVSASSEHGLDLSDEERYKLRAELKMELLRDHMKEYLSKDFKIQLPQRIIGMLPFGGKGVEVKVEGEEGGKS